MTRLEMIKEYVFDIASYTLDALDEIVKLINIDNNWSEEKYISFDVINFNTWQVNFWGNDENIIFQRVNNTNYFKAVL